MRSTSMVENDPVETEAPAPMRPLPARRIGSGDLLAGAREIEIEHHGALYRLRCTSKGKLILTK
jgi:hemin uptake protein HemP